MERQNIELVEKIYDNNYVAGIVEKIQVRAGNEYQLSLSIYTGNDLDLEYSWLCVDYPTKDFLSVGDSLYKASQDKFISIIKADGRILKTQFTFCSE